MTHFAWEIEGQRYDYILDQRRCFSAYDVLKILERFASKGTAANTLHDAAKQIDILYTTDEDASSYWQDKPQSRKKLLRKVRRLIKDLGLPDWNAFKTHMDEFAVRHYAKP